MNNKGPSLFLIQTDYHVYMMADAVREFAIKNIVICWRRRSSADNDFLARLLPSDVNITLIAVHWNIEGFDSEELFFFYKGLVRRLKKIGCKSVFVARFEQQWMQVIALSIDVSNYWLIDDGISTLSTKAFYLNDNELNKKISLIQSGFPDCWRERGLACFFPTEIGLFSVFLTDENSNNFLLNRMESFRNLLELEKPATIRSQLLFVGQGGWIDRGVLDLDQYVAIVVASFNRLGLEGAYYCHPADTEVLKSRLREQNISVLENDVLIEEYWSKNRHSFSDIASFSSTAQFTVTQLFPWVKMHLYKLSLLQGISVTTKDEVLMFDWLEHLCLAEAFLEGHGGSVLNGVFDE